MKRSNLPPDVRAPGVVRVVALARAPEHQPIAVAELIARAHARRTKKASA